MRPAAASPIPAIWQPDVAWRPGSLFIRHVDAGSCNDCDIELTALTQAFRAHTKAKQFCVLGSAKTNVGHLDVAAGVIGLINATQIIKTGKVTRGSIGIQFTNDDERNRRLVQGYGASSGIFVQQVTPGGPAETSAIQR